VKGYQEFRVEQLRTETQKAYCFLLEGSAVPIWVPKSQCDYDADSETVHISAWLVGEKAELEAILKSQDAAD